MPLLACIGCKRLALASWPGLHCTGAPKPNMRGRVSSPHLHQLCAIAFRCTARNQRDGHSAHTSHSQKHQHGPRKVFQVCAGCRGGNRRFGLADLVLALDLGNLRVAWMTRALRVSASRHGVACTTSRTAWALLTLPGWIATAPIVHANNSPCAVRMANSTFTPSWINFLQAVNILNSPPA